MKYFLLPTSGYFLMYILNYLVVINSKLLLSLGCDVWILVWTMLD
jgi:hypothetical protein